MPWWNLMYKMFDRHPKIWHFPSLMLPCFILKYRPLVCAPAHMSMYIWVIRVLWVLKTILTNRDFNQFLPRLNNFPLCLRWVGTVTSYRGCRWAHCTSSGWCMREWSIGEWYWQGKTEVLRDKPALVPLCPPQIPHGLPWDWSRASNDEKQATYRLSYGIPVIIPLGCAIVPAISRRLPTTAARVLSQVKSRGIFGGQSGTGAGFLQVLRFRLPILIPSTARHSSSIIRDWYNSPVSARHTKRTQSHPTPRNYWKN
jgi:hypothetical protein